MGRFETAAGFYKFREPYPPPFFEIVAGKLILNEQTRMLDVGCGPGNLALGFRPFVGSCTALDIEPEMLRIAGESAGPAQIRFLQMPVEELDEAAESFDFVTIGRALHWLSREATLAVLERIVAPTGRIAVCAVHSSDADCNAWTHPFRQLRRAWSGDHDESRYRPDLEEWFAASRFRKLDEISAQQRYRFTVEEIIGRALSFSVTSPAVLGERRSEFEAELRAVLAPFVVDGMLDEEVASKAVVFGRHLGLGGMVTG
jgi:ubiquinone/menaquinone biosynthesis C-methylase UbiE